ncbi:PTS sugar transporter subunit IIA [Lelliottia nimipressuralis]
MAKEITYHCTLSDGIHARPAGHIARICNTYKANIAWQNMRTGIKGNAKNALSLVATDTLCGDNSRITIGGPDSSSAAAALTELLPRLPDLSVLPSSIPGHLPRSLEELHPHYLTGVSLNAGIAIAPPIFIPGISFEKLLAQAPSEKNPPEQELQRLLGALKTLWEQKKSSLQQFQGIEHDLLEAHMELINDDEFQTSISNYLYQGINAWSAIVRASMDFSAVLARSSSRYIQQRTLDILDIATQILSTLYTEHPLLLPMPSLTHPSLVLAHALTPSQLMTLDKHNLSGLVLSASGQNSHTAILAQARNIPTLVDIDFNPDTFAHQCTLVLDADHGMLITEVDEKILRYYHHEMAVQQQKREQPAVAPNSWPLLIPELVQWDLDVEDKNEAIKKMVDNFWLLQRTDSRDKLCQDIWARESPFPTVVGAGFAIPHARTAAVEHSTIGIARLRQPVAWGGVQVDTVFMLTISAIAVENEHMRYFSSLARLLMNDEFVNKAKATTTPIELYNLIFSALVR